MLHQLVPDELTSSSNEYPEPRSQAAASATGTRVDQSLHNDVLTLLDLTNVSHSAGREPREDMSYAARMELPLSLYCARI